MLCVAPLGVTLGALGRERLPRLAHVLFVNFIFTQITVNKGSVIMRIRSEIHSLGRLYDAMIVLCCLYDRGAVACLCGLRGADEVNLNRLCPY